MKPPLVDVVIEDPRWEAAGLEALAEAAAGACLARLGLAAAGFEICLLGADDARVAELNAAFRGKATPTNVLSWPSAERAAADEGARPAPPAPGTGPDGPEPLGDIALAYETCAREAAAAGRTLHDHAAHLVVHGMLHLLGYDHQRDGDATLMESEETAILEAMGISDPYGETARDSVA